MVIALFVRGFFLEAFKIPSGSMIPTLAIGDHIFVNKLRYGLRVPFTTHRLVDFYPPKRGEVVVFVAPMAPHDDFIKRVVALPGDEVEVRHGALFVDGTAVPRQPRGQLGAWDWDPTAGSWYAFTAQAYEERLGDAVYTTLQDPTRPHPDYGPLRIPNGYIFAMGDNRDHSFDSRDWGLVPMSNILGRSTLVWWSWGQGGLALSRLLTWVR